MAVLLLNQGKNSSSFVDFYIDKARFVDSERFWPERFMTSVVSEAERTLPEASLRLWSWLQVRMDLLPSTYQHTH